MINLFIIVYSMALIMSCTILVSNQDKYSLAKYSFYASLILGLVLIGYLTI